MIAIGGIPAVGKTTLVKKFFYEFEDWKNLRYKKLHGHYNEKLNLIILGKYNSNEVFMGTDKLSMAVQPDFEEFIDKEKPPFNIMFEGDRLFNIKTLKKAEEKMRVQVYIIESDFTKSRHLERNDSQSEKFIKGRVTKLLNIKNYLDGNYITLVNNDEADISKNFEFILSRYNNFRGI